MGKAARNERLKITATYLNNIAAGLFVAGFAIPYLAIYPTEHKSIQMMLATDADKLYGLLFALATAFIASMGAHLLARNLLATVED
jgi:formate/nitrite transporter FocA (FNT family)